MSRTQPERKRKIVVGEVPRTAGAESKIRSSCSFFLPIRRSLVGPTKAGYAGWETPMLATSVPPSTLSKIEASRLLAFQTTHVLSGGGLMKDCNRPVLAA